MEWNNNPLARNLVCRVCVLVSLAGPACADWPQFRGPNSSGIAVGPAPPVEFGPGRNELWHVPMGEGHSSPVVVGDFPDDL